VQTDAATIPILTALTVQFALGALVFHANPRRGSNKCFLLLSSAIVVWLSGLYFGLTASSAGVAEISVRLASIGGVLILTAFNWLRLSMLERQDHCLVVIKRSWVWNLAASGAILFCFTPFFLRGAELGLRPADGPAFGPTPIYGVAAPLYGIYFAGAGLLVTVNYIRGLKRTAGSERAELGFILIGVASTLFSVLALYLLRFVVNQGRLIWFAPFRILLFSLIIAYGIATRRIMEIGIFFRRLLSYFVLAAYLVALYSAVLWLVKEGLGPLLHENTSAPYLIAAVVVAFAMAPARGFSQRLADRLFIGSKGLDFRATMGKAAAILSSVTTLHDLLRRFATTIAEAVGTDSVSIYLANKKGEFVRKYPRELPQPARLNSFVSSDGPLVHYLTSHREPLILDELHRVRPTPVIEQVKKRMLDLNAAAALGIYAREHLVGIMLLATRLSGRIYGTMEQDALQVLCGQLAVAVENAELFTEVQNAKIYNDILLENLTTGVVACDADGRITVFNQEAEEIIGLPKTRHERTINDLPESLRAVILGTFATGSRQEDREGSFPRTSDSGATSTNGSNGSNSEREEEDLVYVRASSAVFHGQEGELLGVLMVITDITHLKKMEEQIRRTDRLASLGTLSAGMAHEIKNPLVSIKTFAQLLPERYAESDFRDTFSSLIVHEIGRIDTLVNQLLRFARPSKPLLRSTHVHAVLEKTLTLLQHRLYQKQVNVIRHFEAEPDTISADSDQLEQVFLNFILNAMDAMKRGGDLTVKTAIRTGDVLISRVSADGAKVNEALCVSIRDSGEGINPADIAHVFDPFFTTKDHGTGLGLSVVHGIVQEHGGVIEVESELGKGTTFTIYMPLAPELQEAAA